MIGAITSHYVEETEGPASFADAMTAVGWDAWWRLGEPSGTTAADSSGNAHSLIYQGAPALGADGLVVGDTDKAVGISFGKWVYTDAVDWMNATEFSVFGRFKLTGVSGTQTIVARYESGQVAYGLWSLRLDDAALRLYVFSGAGFSTITLGTITPNVAYTVGVTWNGSIAKGYLNGSLAATSGALVMQSQPARRLDLGAATGTSAASEFMTGTLDEIAYKKSVLSDAAMLSLHQAATAS